MENPYQSPAPADPSPGLSSMVRQVRIVAILMFVQAGFEIVMGLYLCAVVPIIMIAMSSMPQGGGQARPGPPTPAATGWIMAAIYVGLGSLSLIAGGLRIYAGVKNLKYRGRTVGIVAVAFGLITSITGCCAPSSIALAIYGLIVYLNGDVAAAFRLGEQGHSVDEIRRFVAPASRR